MTDIPALVAALETAFNTHDADATAALFTDDCWAVAADGTRTRGHAELLAAHRAWFATAVRDQYARYDLVDTVALDADTALAQVRAVATEPDGTPKDVGHAATALHVLVRRDGRWQVAARQITLVPEG